MEVNTWGVEAIRSVRKEGKKKTFTIVRSGECAGRIVEKPLGSSVVGKRVVH
jgi:uncharacterized protein (UPF0210 family)